MSDYQSYYILLCSLAILSIAINFAALCCHIMIPKLSKHPGAFLSLNFAFQMILLTHWFFTYPDKSDSAKMNLCNIVGIYSILCYYISSISLLFFCIEILIILRLKLYKTIMLRKVIFIVITFLASFAFLIIYITTDSIGVSVYHTCFIKKDSIGEKVDMVLIFLFTSFMLICFICIKRQIDCYTYKTFKHYSQVILLTLIAACINRVLSTVMLIQRRNSIEQTDTEILIGTFSGLICCIIVAVGRLTHPKVRKEIKRLCKRKISKRLLENEPKMEEEIMKSILSTPDEIEVDDISDIFEKLGHRIIVQILVVLTLKFKKNNQTRQSIGSESGQISGKKIQIKFEQSFFTSIALEYNMPFIKNYFCPIFTIIEYEPKIFEEIRKIQKFSDEDMLESLLSYENIKAVAKINNIGGKSESFFFSSRNQKIVIKTITSTERDSLLSFLPAYSKRVNENSESKLVRILGLFQVYPNNQDFMIMENTLGDIKNSIVFDLKGSTADRNTRGIDMSSPPYGIVLKDINFLNFDKKVAIKDSKKLMDALIDDFQMLKMSGIMDYSLLVGFLTEKVDNRYTLNGKYSVAVIDFLQKYGIKKSAEGIWKRYTSRTDQNFSSISPKKYFHRIKNFLGNIFEESKDD